MNMSEGRLSLFDGLSHRISASDFNRDERISMLEDYQEWGTIEFDLQSMICGIPKSFPVTGVYLFGSRGFSTGSLRSDIDLLFEMDGYIKHSEVRKFIDQHCQALDIFILENGRATSVSNESCISFPTSEILVEAVGAKLLWNKESGFSGEHKRLFSQQVADHVDFKKTVITTQRPQMTLKRLKDHLQSNGLPTDPIIGESEGEIARRLIRVAEASISFKDRDFAGHGSARSTFLVNPNNEYHAQDLFMLAAKPWFPEICRESVEVVFDGQKKQSDFNLFGSRLIFEFKFAKDKGDKREIAKTLNGLNSFYSDNANVRCLVFIVYAMPKADIDGAKWESRYSHRSDDRETILRVVRVD